MSNFKEHLKTGAVSGLLVASISNIIKQRNEMKNNPNYKFNLGELIINSTTGTIFGAIGGILPDKIEPAKNPHHRKFFHSKSTLAFISYKTYQYNNKEFPHIIKNSINSFTAGYASHLILDSMTPKGLPVI